MNIEKMLTFLGTYTEALGTIPGDESRIKIRMWITEKRWASETRNAACNGDRRICSDKFRKLKFFSTTGWKSSLAKTIAVCSSTESCSIEYCIRFSIFEFNVKTVLISIPFVL